jgi:hypothetical protein
VVFAPSAVAIRVAAREKQNQPEVDAEQQANQQLRGYSTVVSRTTALLGQLRKK